MSDRGIVFVVIVVVCRSAGLRSHRVVVRRDLLEVMMAERKDEVQRERCKRKPCPEPRS